MRNEKLLFSHPSWMRWWVLPNLESERMKDGVPPPVSHLCPVVVPNHKEDHDRDMRDLKERTEALGLEFVYGIRFSHPRQELIRFWRDPKFHEEMVKYLNYFRVEHIFLDCESYYPDGKRYYGWQDKEVLEIFDAARVWSEIRAKSVRIYPAHERQPQTLAIAGNLAQADVRVLACDSTTYKANQKEDGSDLEDVIAKKLAFYESIGLEYSPGFYLYYAIDPTVIRVLNDVMPLLVSWYFPRTSPNHPDALPDFGKPEWPDKAKRPE